MKSLSTIIAFGLILLVVHPVQAQKKELDTRVNLLFGLTQPLFVQGFNIEGNLFFKRLAFDYSHGISLDFQGGAVSGEVARQNLVAHLPYSTGFGIGYRFNEWFNLRIEPKWHRFEIYQDGAEQIERNLIVGYNTFSLGIGAYVNWRPWKNKENGLNGIMIAPSVRYWPRINSSLQNDQHEYFNPTTGQTEIHEAMQVGVGNTPIIVNVSIGYSFGLKRKPKTPKN